MTTILDVVKKYNPEIGTNKFIAYKSKKGWYLTNNKREAAKPDQIFQSVAAALTKSYQSLRDSGELNVVCRNLEKIKRKYDRSYGIYRMTFGWKDQSRADSIFKFLRKSLKVLEHNRMLNYQVKMIGGVNRLCNLNRAYQSEDHEDLKFVYHPGIRELKFNAYNKPTANTLLKIAKNFPNVETIELPSMTFDEAKAYFKSIPALKKACPRLKKPFLLIPVKKVTKGT